jgi:hypothetical protein
MEHGDEAGDAELVRRAKASSDQRLGRGAKHSIRELRGLGKHVWLDIDAQRYVDAERSSWDDPVT